MEVLLERFEKTELEKELDKVFGRESDQNLIYKDIQRTYTKHLFEKGTEDITVITDLVPEQIYKFAMFEVKIKNTFKSE